MLISGLYNPPKHNYRDSELMSYIISIVDNVLDNHPNAVMIWRRRSEPLGLARIQGTVRMGCFGGFSDER